MRTPSGEYKLRFIFRHRQGEDSKMHTTGGDKTLRVQSPQSQRIFRTSSMNWSQSDLIPFLFRFSFQTRGVPFKICLVVKVEMGMVENSWFEEEFGLYLTTTKTAHLWNNSNKSYLRKASGVSSHPTLTHRPCRICIFCGGCQSQMTYRNEIHPFDVLQTASVMLFAQDFPQHRQQTSTTWNRTISSKQSELWFREITNWNVNFIISLLGTFAFSNLIEGRSQSNAFESELRCVE